MAQDTESTSYTNCAETLKKSILKVMPDANVTIITTDMLPHGDLATDSDWKLINDWQVYEASPYDYTIKLEADMIMTSPFDHWWTLFEQRDVVVSQGCRDIYDQPARSRYYRQLFDRNHLPDLYNAITYWRHSQTAREFFGLVRNIFENWPDYSRILKQPDQEPSTDVVYAMAAVLMGPERVTLPLGLGPTIVHMKQHIIPTLTEDWTRELVWESTNPGLRINTVAQSGAVHYHVKDWRINE
jgi:hypothetical protein